MRPTTFRLLITLLLLTGSGTAFGQTTRYWDTTAGAGNGVGGTATWTAQTDTLFSTASTGSAALTAAATIDPLIFQGTAGTVTLGFNPASASYTFNATGYAITGNSITTRTLTGPVSLAASVNLTIGNGETGNIIIGVAGSVSGGAGSTITINGSATGTNVTRFNLAGANTTVSVPVVATGTGFAAIVGTAAGTQVTGTVTGSGSRLHLEQRNHVLGHDQ